LRPEPSSLLARSLALGSACIVLGLFGRPQASADTVELVSGEVVTGVMRGLADGKVTLSLTRPAHARVMEDKSLKKPKGAPAAATPEELRVIPMTDVVQIKFEPMFDRSSGTHPLIDNDPARNGRPASGTIKLRAGYHRFALAYWHRNGGAFIRLSYSRMEKPNDDRQRFVPGDMLAHLGGGASETPSAGVDKEGYRLPEVLSGEVAPNCEYSVRRRPDGRSFEKMTDVLGATSSVGEGTMDRISTRPLPDESQDVAMLVAGYLHIRHDGLYKFVLSSDGGSQLYVGQTPNGLRSIEAASASAPWMLTLAEGGSLKGTIESWTDSRIGVGVAVGRSRVAVTIPAARVTKIWSNKAPGKEQPEKDDKTDEKIDVSSLPGNQDVVLAHSAKGPVQRVPCRVQGIQGESLVLLFNSETRKVAISKVVGIVLATDQANPANEQPFHQFVETEGGIKFPGQITSIDPAVTKVRTLWGQTVTLKTEDLTSVSVKNGKAISLTDFKPSEVSEVPFFERMIHYRINESLSGGPILLRDGKHNLGISVHAKTVLRFTIGGHFQRFRTKLGFQLPEGELGDASVRVLGDNKVLFERARYRGDDPIEPLDLDVTGVNTLTLAVDFGQREDVGDWVVWADPMLIRTATAPLASVPQ
jgi:hypothetical protein